jgi:hypothetical protein
VLTRRRSSLTGSCVDRRSSVLRSTITFTPGIPVNNPCRCSKSALSFGRTTMSTATSGKEREGRSSRSWSLWPAQNAVRYPPGLPAVHAHRDRLACPHGRTTHKRPSSSEGQMQPLACHPAPGDEDRRDEFRVHAYTGGRPSYVLRVGGWRRTSRSAATAASASRISTSAPRCLSGRSRRCESFPRPWHGLHGSRAAGIDSTR